MALVYLFIVAVVILTSQQDGVIHEYPEGLNWIGDPMDDRDRTVADTVAEEPTDPEPDDPAPNDEEDDDKEDDDDDKEENDRHD